MPLDKEGMNLPYCCLAVLQHVRSTASIGVSHFHQGDNTIDDILSRADMASYQAKQSGRNKVEGDADG